VKKIPPIWRTSVDDVITWRHCKSSIALLLLSKITMKFRVSSHVHNNLAFPPCFQWLFLPFQIYIEFCGGGALDSIMMELEKPLTEPQIRCICRGMCDALGFLHQAGVIHRDLKAGNVLLSMDGCVKLGMNIWRGNNRRLPQGSRLTSVWSPEPTDLTRGSGHPD
jgi:hypothetical protein